MPYIKTCRISYKLLMMRTKKEAEKQRAANNTDMVSIKWFQ